MVPNRAIISILVPREMNSSPLPSRVTLIMLPLTHLYGRCKVFLSIQSGGKIAFYHDNPDYVLRHIRAIGVTRFPTYPKVWTKIKEAIDAEINSLP